MVGLAGCAGPGVDEDAGPSPTPTPDEQAIEDFEDPDHFCVRTGAERAHAPDLAGRPWQIGQYWDYALEVDDRAEEVVRMVFYEERDMGQHYMVGSESREHALEKTVFGVNPMLGRIHRAMYAPHESGDHADMFHFPLCDGSTWRTTFYGEAFDLRAEAADVELPGLGAVPGFVIRGTADSGSTLEHTYSLDAQWFTRLHLERADGGVVRMDLQGLGDGYTGEAHFLRGQQDVVLEVEDVMGLEETVVAREDGGEGPYDLVAVHVDLQAEGTGHARVTLQAPNGTTMWSVDLGTLGQERVERLLELPYAAGDWTLLQVQGPPALPEAVTVQGAIRVVSVYDRGGEV